MKKYLALAIDAARAAGALTLEYYGGRYDLRYKGKDDPVTTADLEADACLKERLLSAGSDFGWLSEETSDDPERLGKSRVWIVDPIDGTREFVERIPEYTVSVALVESGVPVVGVVYNPVRDELYAAVRNGGCFFNGKRVFCSPVGSLDQAVLIVSRSETKRGDTAPFQPHLKTVSSIGSTAYKLALVAAGKADLNLSVRPKNEWDVCAGDLLVREAGGRMLDLQGQTRSYNQADPRIEGGLVSGNPELTKAALELIRRLG